MPAFTATRFSGPAFLSTSATTLYTVPAGRSAVVKQFIFNNTSASSVTVTAHVVTSGGSAAASNAVVSSLTIAPYSQIIWAADIPMTAGETVRALAGTANAVTLTTTGIEVS